MRALLTLLFLLSATLFAEILETDRFETILDYCEPNAIFVIDVDNTLITPVQELGTNKWFCHRMDHYLALGYGLTEALGRALPEWEAVQHITTNEVVEESTPDVLRDLQQRGYFVMALATRGLGLSTKTVHQLQEFSIDFSQTVPNRAEVLLFNPRDVLFRKGILFTSGTHKGRALFKLFDEWGYRPSKVVFINDKISHLCQVEESCREAHIPFVGLRYSYLDERVNNFRPEIADIQFEHFCEIMPNHEAEKILVEQTHQR